MSRPRWIRIGYQNDAFDDFKLELLVDENGMESAALSKNGIERGVTLEFKSLPRLMSASELDLNLKSH